MLFAYVCTSYYTLVRTMAFEYDRFAVVLAIEVFFIGYPVLVGTVVTGSLRIYLAFFAYQCHSLTV